MLVDQQFFSNFYLYWFFSNLFFFERDHHMDSPEGIRVNFLVHISLSPILCVVCFRLYPCLLLTLDTLFQILPGMICAYGKGKEACQVCSVSLCKYCTFLSKCCIQKPCFIFLSETIRSLKFHTAYFIYPFYLFVQG